MRDHYGGPDRPIWLIGDSNPNCELLLEHPLDPRHPSRHNIWTPVLDVIQERVYPRRLRAFGYDQEADVLYIRNAVVAPADRSNASAVAAQIESLREGYRQHRPLLVLSFGAFAFALCKTALESQSTDASAVIKMASKLTVRALAKEFVDRAGDRERQLLPLLHQSVAKSFAHVHKEFKAYGATSYFDYTGSAIAKRLLEQPAAPIWRT